MGERCLRLEISSCVRSELFDASRPFYVLDNNLFYKDGVTQTKCIGIEVKIASLRWVIIDLSWWPDNIVKFGTWDTVLRITEVVVGWRA